MRYLWSLLNSAVGRVIGCFSALFSLVVGALSLGLLLWQVYVQTRSFQRDPTPEPPKVERPAKRR